MSRMLETTEVGTWRVPVPSCAPLPMTRHTWPDYCFDEFFMAVAAYQLHHPS